MLIAYRTTWWQQLGMATLNFHVAHPWFFLIYATFGLVAVWYHRVEKRKKSEQQKRRKFLEEQAFKLSESK